MVTTQPRTCDIRLADFKKHKIEAKRKKEAEKARRDAEYAEAAKDRAAKFRRDIKESEEALAESQERFRKTREKNLRKAEQVLVPPCCSHWYGNLLNYDCVRHCTEVWLCSVDEAGNAPKQSTTSPRYQEAK